MGIYLGLVEHCCRVGDLQPGSQAQLFNSVQRKAESDIRELLGASPLSDMMVALPI